MRHCRILAIVVGFFASAVHATDDDGRAENLPKPGLQRYEFLQIRMAVPVSITVYAGDERAANQATRAAYARIKQLDRLLSHYDPDSELSQLARDAAPGTPVPVSAELLSVLLFAQDVSQRTGGAFDVTVGPLMDLWRTARRERRLPDPTELEQAKQLVGFGRLRLDAADRTVSFEKREMHLDLGGIAKGYAADEALRVLKAHGIARALIDAGGDIVAGDPPPGAAGWKVGVAPLGSPEGVPERFLTLSNAAVATSGDAVQFVEIDGVRYSHLLDPRTGLGVTTRSSVTVVAPDGITADSWASAVSVLGPARGLNLLETVASTDALIVIRDGDGLQTFESPDFSRFQAGNDLPLER